MKLGKLAKEYEPRVVVCIYDLTLWFMKKTNRFPKNWRITLGDQIDRILLEMLLLSQKAAMKSDKKSILTELSEHIELLRTLTRLSMDLNCLQGRQYEYVSRQIDEIGRQIGGWIKNQEAKR